MDRLMSLQDRSAAGSAEVTGVGGGFGSLGTWALAAFAGWAAAAAPASAQHACADAEHGTCRHFQSPLTPLTPDSRLDQDSALEPGWSLRPLGAAAPIEVAEYARCFSEDSVLSAEALSQWRRRVGLSGQPYGSRYFAIDRWASYHGGYSNNPVDLTWSLVPDGTVCEAEGRFYTSTLFQTMDSQFGGDRDLWIGYMESCFENISRVSGARFTRVRFINSPTDDGAPLPDSDYAPGIRGDVRICSYAITNNAPGLNTLAYCRYPGFGGDMTLDSAEPWNLFADSFRFLRNVFTHELGHGMGLDHSCPLQRTKLMEPIYSSQYDVLQHDDILGLQYLYGDPQEPNEDTAQARVYNETQPNSSLAFYTYEQVPDTATASVLPGDQDWTRSSVAASMPVTFTATPMGTTYDTSPQGQPSGSNSSGCTSGNFVNSRLQTGLRVEIRNAFGSVIAGAQGAPGQAVTVSAQVPQGNYYSVVSPVSDSFAMPQMYTLTRTAGAPQPPRNDPWYEAILLGQDPYGMTINGTTTGATTDGNAFFEPGGIQGTQDVYYNFYPWDGAGRMRVTVTGGNHVVSVHRAGNSAPSYVNQWAPFGANGGLGGVVDVNLTNFDLCTIRVAVANGGTPGPHTVSVRYIDGPTNDSCLTPVDITSGVYNGTTIFARPEPSPYPASCTTDTATLPWGAWYRYTATTRGVLSLSVCNAQNTIMGVYDGCPDAGGALVACNDNAPSCGNGGSALSLPVVAGRQYLVRVSHAQNLSGPFQLNVGFARDGETCADPVAISAGETPFSNVGYTTDDTSCSSGSNRWYRYTATGYSTVSVTTCGSADYDTTLAAWNACPASGGQLVACNDDACGLQSSISFTSVPGQEFLLSVGGYNGRTGSGTLRISETPVPGETCSAPIVVSDGSTPFSTAGHYTNGPAEPNCLFCCDDPQIHADLWYLYFATATGTARVSTCDANYDSKMTAYASCPTGDGQAIACADDDCGLQAAMLLPVIEGHSYLIRVGGFGGWSGSGTLVITPPSSSCPADFNQDGGVDGADVDAFFSAWEGGEAAADVNEDGGIDGGDVELFFSRWEAGGC